MAHSPTAVSLFTGAGGLDLGIERAGYRVVFAVEREVDAVATLNRNRARFFRRLPEVEALDITVLDPKRLLKKIGASKGEIDLLVGGPPCVAFSKSGFHLEYKRKGEDPRASLLDEYLRFLRDIRPRSFILENVFGLAYRNQSAPFFTRFTSGARRHGYSVSFSVLNAADFGVPQNRQRLFVIGTREGQEYRFPSPTHWGQHERRTQPSWAKSLLPHTTAGEALAGLRTEPEPGETVNGKWGHLLPEIPVGGNYLHFTREQGYAKPLFRWRSRYWTFLLKLDPKRPSPTIQAQPGPYVGPFHWKNRRLRVPELKRLQGFPDDFDVRGGRRSIQLQVGNSVPPELGYAVAAAVREQGGH